MNAFRTRSKNKIWPALVSAAVYAVTEQAASKESPEVVARAQMLRPRWRMPSWWIVSFLDG